MHGKHHLVKGYTLVELLIVAGLGALILTAVVALFSGSIASYRSQLGAIFATSNARVQVQRIVSSLRAAQSHDVDSWLIDAQDNVIEVWTDVEGDGEVEKIKYELSGSTLTRTLTKGGGANASGIVARTVTNGDEPLFIYYDTNGNTIADKADRSAASVKSIGISLSVKNPLGSGNESIVVNTTVTPREGIQGKAADHAMPDDSREVTLAIPPSFSQGTGTLHVITRNTSTGSVISDDQITVNELNDGRLTVYESSYYAILNYKKNTYGNSEGLYIWVARGIPAIQSSIMIPIFPVTAPDSIWAQQDMHSKGCLGNSFSAVTGSDTVCSTLSTIIYPLLPEDTFRPILTYTGDSATDYVRDIIITSP